MEFAEWVACLDGLDKVMLFAIDDKAEKYSDIPWNDYHQKLYLQRAQEDELAVQAASTDASNMTILIAPQGGGKTSLLTRKLRSLPSEVGYLLLDLKKHQGIMSRLSPANPEQVLQGIDHLLREELSNQFLRDPAVFASFVVAALDMFFNTRVQKLVLVYRKGKKDITRSQTLDRLLEDTEKLSEASEFVEARISSSQALRALMRILGQEKFMLVLDNIDRIGVDLQPILLSLAIDIWTEGHGAFGVLAALRNKNIVRYQDSGLGGNVIRIVSLNNNELLTAPIKLGEPIPKDVENLFLKRQQYAKGTFFPKHSITPTNYFWSIHEQIRQCLNQRLVEVRLHNLANWSFRQMLVMNMGFTRHLFRLVAQGTIKTEDGRISLSIRDCVSYLYRWLYAGSGNPQHELLRDTISKYVEYSSYPHGEPISCDLDLVILTWLVNHSGQPIRVGHLVKDFQRIGVSRNLVAGTLYELYDVANPTRRHVELGSREQLLKRKEISNATRVQILPLGREFLTTTMTKFEFLQQALANPDVLQEDSEELLAPLSKAEPEAVKEVLEHLERMKTVHLAALERIKQALEERGIKSWLAYYKARFCIDSQLIIERIVFQHLAYFRSLETEYYSDYEKTYSDLLANYQRKIPA